MKSLGLGLDTNYRRGVFAPTQMTGLALWLRSDMGVTIAQGPVASSGTAPPAVTLTGSPAAAHQDLEINITLSGARGTAQFRWKLNGVVQQTAQVTAATFALGTTGITANFPVGAYTNDDVYTSVVVVSSWADQGGAARNKTQSTPAARPVLSASGIGAYQALSFNGSQFLADGSSLVITDNHTTFVVWTTLDTSAQRAAVSCRAQDASNGIFFGIDPTNPGAYRNGGSGWLTGTASISAAAHVMFMTGSSNPGGGGHLYFDGTLIASDVSESRCKMANLDVGGDSGGGSWEGLIAEVVVFNRLLDATDLNQVHGYLKRRYGIA